MEIINIKGGNFCNTNRLLIGVIYITDNININPTIQE